MNSPRAIFKMTKIDFTTDNATVELSMRAISTGISVSRRPGELSNLQSVLYSEYSGGHLLTYLSAKH